MNNSTLDNNIGWYLRILLPLNSDMKLAIINRLSASMLTKKKKKKNRDFFDGLNNSWCDGVSADDEIAMLREARTFYNTRVIEEF